MTDEEFEQAIAKVEELGKTLPGAEKLAIGVAVLLQTFAQRRRVQHTEKLLDERNALQAELTSLRVHDELLIVALHEGQEKLREINRGLSSDAHHWEAVATNAQEELAGAIQARRLDAAALSEALDQRDAALADVADLKKQLERSGPARVSDRWESDG